MVCRGPLTAIVLSLSDNMPPPITLGDPTHLETDLPITCIDACRTKPLILAGTSDGTVFLFHQSRGKVLTKSLHDPLSSVALHPSGLAAAYTFGDQICLAHIVDGDLHPFLEFKLPQPSNVSFNRGGSVLAVAHGSRISLFDFMKATKICEIVGTGASVVATAWSPCNSMLYTLDEATTLGRWSIDMSRGNCILECSLRLGEHSTDASPAPSITLPTKDQVWVLVDGTIQKLSTSSLETITGGTLGGLSSDKIQAMAASSPDSSLVFVGVDAPAGHVLRLLSAIGETKKILEDIPLEDSISHLHVSESDDALVVAGTSGGLSVYAITDHRRGACENKTSAYAVDDGAALLISNQQLDDLANAVDNLQRSINDSKIDHEFNIRRKENSIIEDVEKARAACLEEGENRAERLHSLEMEVIATKLKAEREQREMALRHTEETNRIEEERRRELAKHVRTSKATETFVTKGLDRIQQERRILALDHRHQVQTLQNELEERFETEYNKRVGLEKKLLALQEEFGIAQEVVGEELDAGVESIKRQYQEKLEAERDAALHLMSSNGILKKKITSALAQIESNKDTVQNQLMVEENLKREESLVQEEAAALDEVYGGKVSTLEAQNSHLADLHEEMHGLEEYITALENRSSSILARIERRHKEAADIDLQSAALTAETDTLNQKTDGLGTVVSAMQVKVKEKNQFTVGLSRKIAKQESPSRDYSGGLKTAWLLFKSHRSWPRLFLS